MRWLACLLAVASAATAAEPPEMWAPRPDAPACERVRSLEEVARLIGIAPFRDDHVTRIAMDSGDVIWTFFVPAESLTEPAARRAAQLAWPKDFLLFEARLTEERCLESARGIFADLAAARARGRP